MPLVGKREVLGRYSQVCQHIFHGNPFAACEDGLAFVEATAVFLGFRFQSSGLVILDQNFQDMDDGG